MVRAASLLLGLSLVGCTTTQPIVREVTQTLRSTGNPALSIRVAADLAYLGHIESVAMNGRASFDEYIFSDIRGGELGRTVIAHFERTRPGVDFAFRYPRLDMVTLGRHEYLHQSWPDEDWDLFESDAMKTLMTKRGVHAPRRWLVDRYVRAVGSDLRAEVILFYLEPGGELPAPVAELKLAGSRRDLWTPIARELAKRARAVFSVQD